MILKSFFRIISNKTDQKDSSKNINIENNSRLCRIIQFQQSSLHSFLFKIATRETDIIICVK